MILPESTLIGKESKNCDNNLNENGMYYCGDKDRRFNVWNFGDVVGC